MLSNISTLYTIPCMSTQSLLVTSSAEVDILTPPSNKRILVYGYWAHQHVAVNANPTTDAQLYFGDDNTDQTKRIAAFHQESAGDSFGIALSGLMLCGEVDEIVSLINMAYEVGTTDTEVILYYGVK